MRDGHDSAGVIVQELLKPEHRFRVKVVGGLIKKQQVRCLEKQTTQGYTAFLATRKVGDGRVWIRALKRVHCLRELAVQIPAVSCVDLGLELSHLCHERVKIGVRIAHLDTNLVEARDLGKQVTEGKLNVLLDRFGLIQRRLLLEQANGVTWGKLCLAVRDVLHAGNNLEQGGLSHSVWTHDADFCARVHTDGDVIKDDLLADSFAGFVHLIDKLCHVLLLKGLSDEIFT